MNDDLDIMSAADGDDPLAIARAHLDQALASFNRQAIAAEQCQAAVLTFRLSGAAFDLGTDRRSALRSARESAAARRDAVHEAILHLVRLKRDAGSPPEAVLVAIKRRLSDSQDPSGPSTPTFEARSLEVDASRWTITEYYS